MAGATEDQGFAPGDRVVIVRGFLSGIEASVVRPASFGFYLIRLDADAPRWAAIRRTRAAAWALAPLDGAGAPAAPVLERRRRVGLLDLAAATVLLPLLLRVWNIVPSLAVVLAIGAVAGLAALHSADRRAT